MDDDKWRDIVHIQLDEKTIVRRRPEVEQERRTAIFDLIEENRFRLVQGPPGPYTLHLRLEDSRLVFDLRTLDGLPLTEVRLPLTPFSRMVKDYLMVCSAYYQTLRETTLSHIEAVDVGRRGLHDEGAALLDELLRSRVEMDHPTARRLFTLLCVLHIRA
ncbi:MAG: hypothetical protein FD149_1983 [Rhodospirillaceae bacterium]|nr:MAG: hypothetical protein FD149_1983 [Rhodospirillaceae bacterium]